MHTNEVVRRILNTSRKLEWKESVAPVLTEYMRRMMRAGYEEYYRRDVLKHGLAVFDKKIENEENGTCPLNRPSGYKTQERRKEKRAKMKEWGKKGGYIAPIIVPSTPGGELAKEIRKVVEENAKGKINFKVVEKGGQTLERQLQRSNPTK